MNQFLLFSFFFGDQELFYYSINGFIMDKIKVSTCFLG